MKSKKTSMTMQYVVIMSVLLLVANVILGAVLIVRSLTSTKTLIRQNMLSISKTASEIVNGDELGALTEADVDGPVFNKIKEQLTVFQNNVDIKYIYAVRKISETEYVFTVDPDPVDPGKFGEYVVVTDALRKAATGIASVDDEVYTDRWGTYYSSYSPVYDSNGKIAGIIGIDFDSEEYDRQLLENSEYIIIITVLFVAFGILIVFLINQKVDARFKKLNSELSILSNDVDELNNELTSDKDFYDSKPQHQKENGAETAPLDEIEEIGTKIHFMHSELKRYIEYTHIKANTDALTSVRNSAAYFERQLSLTQKIADGTADFSLAVFDINYLKQINDIYGHFVGDKVIRSSAKLIAYVFSADCTYRIGGDEFAVIVENKTAEEMESSIKTLEKDIEDYNKSVKNKGFEVSLSCGYSTFDFKTDTSFKEVFIRADKIMYEKKTDYHNKHSD